MAHETFLDGRVTMLLGDVRAMLKTLPDDHFDCVVTSPPYWGLRDYGVAGQLGLEPSLGEHIEVMVAVFEDVRRVLKPTGTLWLNYGDCYATSPNGRSAADTKAAGNDDRTFRDKPFSTIGPILQRDRRSDRGGARKESYRPDSGTSIGSGGYLKPKDLCMIPNRIAIALQEAGWWVRSEIIWNKTNPMPDSAKDRPGAVHEKIWLLTKSERYFFDNEAIKEPREGKTHDRGSKRTPPIETAGVGHKDWCQYMTRDNDIVDRNARNVWSFPTSPFPQAHFATFPPELAERCIKAGSSIVGNCPHCGSPWERITDREQISLRPKSDSIRGNSPSHSRMNGSNPQRGSVLSKVTTLGFAPSCGCSDHDPIPSTILDIFGGSGTVALVAASLGRKSTLIELNPEYAAMARARIESAFMGKDEGSRHMVKQTGKLAVDAGPLFR